MAQSWRSARAVCLQPSEPLLQPPGAAVLDEMVVVGAVGDDARSRPPVGDEEPVALDFGFRVRQLCDQWLCEHVLVEDRWRVRARLEVGKQVEIPLSI